VFSVYVYVCVECIYTCSIFIYVFCAHTCTRWSWIEPAIHKPVQRDFVVQLMYIHVYTFVYVHICFMCIIFLNFYVCSVYINRFCVQLMYIHVYTFVYVCTCMFYLYNFFEFLYECVLCT